MKWGKMLTRKHFQATAEILNTHRKFIHPAAYQSLIKEFAKVYSEENPSFDPVKFAKVVYK
jgi:hypothetical protein